MFFNFFEGRGFSSFFGSFVRGWFSPILVHYQTALFSLLQQIVYSNSMQITKEHFKLSRIPKDPGIYALYDHSGGTAYVGISNNIRERINQHFIKKDSSITTGVSAVVLNTDKIAKVVWWLHDAFAEKAAREAAELVASEVFNPILRSRGKTTNDAKAALEKAGFKAEMEQLFSQIPENFWLPKTLDNLFKLSGE